MRFRPGPTCRVRTRAAPLAGAAPPLATTCALLLLAAGMAAADTYLGCYEDKWLGSGMPRLFSTYISTTTPMTPAACSALAAARGFGVYGVQFGAHACPCGARRRLARACARRRRSRGGRRRARSDRERRSEGLRVPLAPRSEPGHLPLTPLPCPHTRMDTTRTRQAANAGRTPRCQRIS